MMRLFIGLGIPARAPLCRVIDRLSDMGPSVRPVRATHLHITLRFLGDVPAIKGKLGAPRYRFDELYADRAYDCNLDREALYDIGTPHTAPRHHNHGSGLGKVRWVVERSISWLHPFRRPRVRDKRRLDIHEARLTLDCILICHRMLEKALCQGL